MNIMSVNPAVTLAAKADGAGLLVMKKALDTFSRDGRNMVDLLKQSAPSVSPPNLGNTIDLKA
jgi:hypothetical protein